MRDGTRDMGHWLAWVAVTVAVFFTLGVAGTTYGWGEPKVDRSKTSMKLERLPRRTGLVLDAVNVRKKIKESGFSVKGLGYFIQGLTKKKLKGADASIAHDRKEGIDKALRACIEEAIYELVKRYGE